MKIKICGITDPEMAFFAAQAGADYIGIVRHKKSKRYVEDAKEIAVAAIEGGAIPVAVYVDVYEDLGIETVQFKKSHIVLPQHYTKIIVNESACDENDFLLFDHPEQGSGTAFDWDAFEPPAHPWFLAGGLNADNVEEAIKKLKPYGVDVSSGVERDGRKDKKLIEEFIEKVRSL